MHDTGFLRFPDGFVWGTAASSYQVEGAWNEAGRGLSIWDIFCRTPGKVWRGETGDVAADHYHRWPEDIQIMADLGLNAYRFSTAWPRILPEGSGRVNPAGLDFYDRLVDALLAKGITPYVCPYHWDLPQDLQDAGGWPNRDIVKHFSDYARVVAQRLGDRVVNWLPHNEPFVAAVLGYLTGEHAPGLQDPAAALAAVHHLLLSHGYAAEAIREVVPTARIGIAANVSPIYPASDSDEDQQAAARYDMIVNHLFLDPLFLGHYPTGITDMLGPLFPEMPTEDMQHIASSLDWIGINYYSRSVIKNDPSAFLIGAMQVQPVGNDYSGMWEIYPDGMYDLLMRIQHDYHPAEMLVTENGICVPDGLDFDGRVRDIRRTAYLHDHLAQVHRAIRDGASVRGYFVWSLLDNFEWAYGYSKRFGLVYVDFDTQQRTVKDSGRWFAQVVKENGLARP